MNSINNLVENTKTAAKNEMAKIYRMGCDLADMNLYKTAVDTFGKFEDYLTVRGIEQMLSERLAELEKLKDAGKIAFSKYFVMAKNYLSYKEYAKKTADELEQKIRKNGNGNGGNQ